MQGYPDMPHSREVLMHVERLVTRRKRGTLTVADVAVNVIEYVLTMEPSVRAAVQAEHNALVAFYERERHADEYERLKSELNVVSAATRLTPVRGKQRDR